MMLQQTIKRKITTLKDVAHHARVSHQTVSRVINKPELVSPSTRTKVRTVMEALHFTPNKMAQSLAGKSICTLGIITVSLSLHAPSQIVASIKRHAQQMGYSIIIAMLENADIKELQKALDEMRAQNIEGIIINLPLFAEEAEKIVEENNDLTCIFLEVPSNSKVSHVCFDFCDGSKKSVEFLYDAGHRDFALLAGPKYSVASYMRLYTWQNVLKEKGLIPRAVLHGDWSSHDAWRQTLRLFKNQSNISALLVANDQMAFGAISALYELQIDVPGNVSVVGYDGTPESAYFIPPLTTVEQNFDHLGEKAVTKMIDYLSGECTHESLILPTRFLERKSTSPLQHDRLYERDKLLNEMTRMINLLKHS